MERSIKSRQRRVRHVSFSVSANGEVVSGLDKNQVTVVDTGTGVKTITLKEPFAAEDYQILVGIGTADAIAQVAISSRSAFVVNTFDATDGTTAKDAITHILVIGSDIVDRY